MYSKELASERKLVPMWGHAAIFTHLHPVHLNGVATEYTSTKWHNNLPPVLSPIPVLRCPHFPHFCTFQMHLLCLTIGGKKAFMWIILPVHKILVYLLADGTWDLMTRHMPKADCPLGLLRKRWPWWVQPTHSQANMATSTNEAQHPNPENSQVLFSKYKKRKEKDPHNNSDQWSSNFFPYPEYHPQPHPHTSSPGLPTCTIDENTAPPEPCLLTDRRRT